MDQEPEEVSEIVDTIEETVEFIKENRPDDPEAVSYALDDLTKQTTDLQAV